MLNTIERNLKTLFVLSLLCLLQACGGGGSSNSVSSSGGATATPAAPTLVLTSSSSAVSAAAPATLTATLKNGAGTPVPGAVVTFATAGTGFATFFPTAATALTDANGVATVTLNAGASQGADSVSATATVNGTAVTSNAVGFTVSSAPVTQTPASISFVSASPTTIAIKGTGGQENSSVQFVVRDSNGNALANQVVNFALNTSAGGITLGSPAATSASDGSVTALLQAGTTAVPVRVTASLASNPAISSVSSQLVVSTAIPHQNGFSIAATLLNIEAYSFDGVTTDITARLSDRYGNLVPDGTAVSFRTEGGQSSITPSCTTSGGACTVTLTSSGRRPADGRLTVLATAIGEESFTDTNGNGVYDLGEPFDDRPEAFIDGNENGVRSTNTTEVSAPLEEFVDFNQDGTYTAGDGLFNGVLRACDLAATTANPIPPGCPSVSGRAPAKTINVRSSIVIVLSGSVPSIAGLPSTINLPSCSSADTTLLVRVADGRNNYLAPGTTITIATTNGTITSPTSITIPDSNANQPYAFALSLHSDGTSSGGTCTNTVTAGTLTVTVKTPKGAPVSQSATVLD